MSFQESVNRLEKIVEKCEECNFKECEKCQISWSDVQAISIVLGNLDAALDMYESAERDLKRQKQINKEHKKINGELREKVKGLEEHLQQFYNGELYTAKQLKNIEKNQNKYFINKQEIKDRFEKTQKLYEKNIDQIDFKEVEKIDIKIFEGIKLEAEKELLRKLLQESEDKNAN